MKFALSKIILITSAELFKNVYGPEDSEGKAAFVEADEVVETSTRENALYTFIHSTDITTVTIL